MIFLFESIVYVESKFNPFAIGDKSYGLAQINQYWLKKYKIPKKKSGVGVEEDHIHCLFKAKPTTALAKFTNAYKSAIFKNHKKGIP